MHHLLTRQLQRLGLDEAQAPSKEQWLALLQKVSATYDDADQDRYLLERSMEISSKEMMALYDSVRQQSENRVEVEHQKLRSVMDSLSDGLCVLDDRGVLQFINPAGEYYFQDAADNLVGCSVLSRFTLHEVGQPEEPLLTEELLRRLAAGESFRDDRGLLLQDDDDLAVSCVFNPLFVDDEFLGQVFLFRDISERRRFEISLHQAQQDAEQASRSKSEFLATMSHEIRTPINGVMGMLGLLLDSSLDEDQRDCADNAYRSSEALLSIINDVLDFSKIEADQLQLEHLEFDPQLLVEELLDFFAETAAEKRLSLMAYIDPNVPETVFGDIGRVRQVLSNLISNAIKFTDQGDVLIRLLPEAEDLIRCEVRDTGIGLSTEHSQKLFERFIQADASTTRRYGGTGLGLSISKRLVEKMGGDIGVQSEVGQGSTFWFNLPTHVKDRRQDAPSLSGLSLLLLDSGHYRHNTLVEQLQSWQIEVTQVASLPQALLKLEASGQKQQFDLVVINRHQADGLIWAEVLQAMPHLMEMPMLVFINFRQHLDHSRYQRLARTFYLRKPLKASLLYQHLMAVAEKRLLSLNKGNRNPHTQLSDLSYQGKSVLVVEDNLVNQKILQRMLEKMDVAVDVAVNGLEALLLVQQHRYDLILMDCQMPVMDGYEATQKLRKRERAQRRYVPIIGITANALVGDREKCLDAGMDDYLPKPIRPAELRGALQEWLAFEKESHSA
ncbi:MAG: response regulator [Gammaproteobacteria bacterium]|nr:response regulator [Gammaproteobacteria bacterium]